MAEARGSIIVLLSAANNADRASADLGGLVAAIDGADLRARVGEISHSLSLIVRELKDLAAAHSGGRH
jgi:hypothetical protein